MTTISPSLLSADFMNLQNEIEQFKDIDNIWLHLDIMDGHFVPNMTFGIPIIKQISKITNIPLDAHLMVTNPNFHIIELKDFGIHNITFHLEAENEPMKLVELAKEHFPSVGISIRPNTAVKEIGLDLLSHIDLVLVMSVEPGFGGQSFMPNSLDKVRELVALREKHSLSFKIQIDGGINDQTGKQAVEAGVDNMVAGSYVFKEGPTTYKTKINSLR
jgi:ribulose-phosphate 3-epimerase